LPFLSSLQAGLFTAEQLARYDGSRGNKLVYLAVMGEVFDVSPGARHYGEAVQRQRSSINASLGGW
jgi:predicted heme/steroid binding protein